jgi:hypothetical protein
MIPASSSSSSSSGFLAGGDNLNGADTESDVDSDDNAGSTWEWYTTEFTACLLLIYWSTRGKLGNKTLIILTHYFNFY